MITKFKEFLSRHKLATIAAVVVIGLASVTAAGLGASNSVASASECDKVNIIYCGLSGSSANGYINSFQNYYNTNKSGHDASPTVGKNYTDIQKVFNHFGASSSIVAGMNTTNTKIGYVYRDGRVVVDGKTVGTGAEVAARFSVAGAYNISGTNVYVRKTTSSFAQDKATVIVYFQNDQMVFGVMVTCGNAIKAKPVEQPKPQTLSCVSLTATPTSVKDQYTFTATSSTTNGATVGSYAFAFGNGQSATVSSSANTAATTYTYTAPGSFTAAVTVNGTVNGAATPATGPACQTPITIAPPEQGLACVSLKAVPTSTKNQYTFNAIASTSNGATVANYVFDFGDTKNATVTTNQNTASTTYTYAGAGTYNAKVTVNGTANGNPATSTNTNCGAQITITATPECKPGIPEGDVRCKDVCAYNPALPVDSPECKAPELPHTGPAGMMTLFGATSAFGAVGHRLYLKRRLR